jgi:hypothetical protein
MGLRRDPEHFSILLSVPLIIHIDSSSIRLMEAEVAVARVHNSTPKREWKKKRYEVGL